MHSPWVTVVIPTKARPALLAEALESVRRQTFSDWQCIVAVDGANAETVQLLESVRKKDSRFEYFVVHDGGTAARVRNAAILRVTTPFMAFLDDDDVWLDNKLAIQHAVFEENPDTVLCCGRIEEFGERTATWPAGPVPNILDTNLLCSGNFVATSTVVARASVVIGASGFNPDYTFAEDYDLWLRISTLGDLRFVDSLLCRYRVHGGNISRNQVLMLEQVERILKRRFQEGHFSPHSFRKRMRNLYHERARMAVYPHEAFKWRVKALYHKCRIR